MSKEKEQVELYETSLVQGTEEDGDAIDEKKLLRKLDWHLVPGLTLLFLLSLLDRSNGNLSPSYLSLPLAHPLSVGNARIEGLTEDTHMSAHSPQFPQLCYHDPYQHLKCKLVMSSSPH